MRKILVVVAVIAVIGLVALVEFLSAQNTLDVDSSASEEAILVTCTQEAMICPDGTTVGREGESCQFATCPVVDQIIEPLPGGVESGQVSIVTEGLVELGQAIMLSEVQIVPLAVVSDSRCPEDVECIWAGTFELKVGLSNQEVSEEVILTMGEAISFAGNMVKLAAVYPEKTQSMSDEFVAYRFAFEVN